MESNKNWFKSQWRSSGRLPQTESDRDVPSWILTDHPHIQSLQTAPHKQFLKRDTKLRSPTQWKKCFEIVNILQLQIYKKGQRPYVRWDALLGDTPEFILFEAKTKPDPIPFEPRAAASWFIKHSANLHTKFRIQNRRGTLTLSIPEIPAPAKWYFKTE